MAQLIWIITALLVGAYITGPLVDPDIWWHLVVGRWILAHGELPAIDHWNMFGVGQPWIAYSWSNEIIYSVIEKIWGINGLLAAQAILAIFLVGVFMWVCGVVAKDYFFGALMGIFIATASQSHYTLRPQSLTWGLLALMLWIASHISQKGMSKRALGSILLLSCIWANSHITAWLGVGIAALWSIPTESNRAEQFRYFLLVFAAGLIGCFLTPYFGAEMVTLLTKADHQMAFTTVAEFQPAHITHFSVGILVLGLSLLMLFLHLQPRALSLFRLIVIGLTTVAGLAVLKFLPLAAISIALGISCVWSSVSNSPTALTESGVGV